MKIAIIGSFLVEVPLKPGVIHAPVALSYNLAKELANLNHQVTYFGAYGKNVSKLSNLKFVDFERPIIPKKLISAGDYVSSQLLIEYEQGYFSRVLEKLDKFDLVYSWYGSLIAPLARQTTKPVIATHHDSTNIPRCKIIFEACYSDNLFLIPISKHMESLLSYKNNLSPTYNGVNIDEIPERKPLDYFCWVGRVSPSKGLHITIDLAKKLNFKLKIVGPMKEKFADFGDVSDYILKIKKEINQNQNIEYLGEMSHDETLKIIGESKGLIFPSSGAEACPMVPIESIVAGTPVITSDKGPLPEIVDDKISGFICKNEKEMIKAVKNISKIDRQKCRSHAIGRFSSEMMAKNYLQQFTRAIKINKKGK